MLSVVCWKWKPLRGTVSTKKTVLYTAEDVNRLYGMLQRHLHIPFHLMCVTDDPVGISEKITCIALWDEFRGKGGCFTRLVAFRSDIGELFGPRFVSIDLDCVIVSDITALFNRSEDFIIWGNHGGKTQYCASLWMMDAGCRPQVYNQFCPDDYLLHPKWNKYVGGTDQHHISKVLHDEIIWTKLDGLYAYRNLNKRPNQLPENARIIFFNGIFHPRQDIVQEYYSWVKEYYVTA